MNVMHMTHSKAHRQADRQIGRQTDRQTGTKTHRQAQMESDPGPRTLTHKQIVYRAGQYFNRTIDNRTIHNRLQGICSGIYGPRFVFSDCCPPLPIPKYSLSGPVMVVSDRRNGEMTFLLPTTHGNCGAYLVATLYHTQKFIPGIRIHIIELCAVTISSNVSDPTSFLILHSFFVSFSSPFFLLSF